MRTKASHSDVAIIRYGFINIGYIKNWLLNARFIVYYLFR
jgi:hypothetical protein